jgi:hypothetical protein
MAQRPNDARDDGAEEAGGGVSGEAKEVWGYGDGDYAETWHGMEGSRDEAIAEGANYYGEGVAFWIVRGRLCHPAEFLPDADDMLETAAERACDNVGDAAEDWPPTPSKDALAELNMFIVAWAEKHCPCRFWMQEGTPEHIEPKAATP